MDEFDEFGNYIGPVQEGPDEDEEEDDLQHPEDEDDEDMFKTGGEENGAPQQSDAIVLHEDKALYPSAQSIFGDDVEIVTEDAPITNRASTTKGQAKPVLPREFVVHEKKKKHPPKTSEDIFDDFVRSAPGLVRTVAFVGHIHSGKSSLMQLLHRKEHDTDAKARDTTNVRTDERAMKITIKTRAISSSCEGENGKSYFLQTLDCPGHINFSDEVECALEIADGAVLCIDCVEGVQLGTEQSIAALSRHGLLDFTVVCFTKFDRLIHELKLPPVDAYRKLAFILSEVDDLFSRYDARIPSLERGQVLFSSSLHSFCFSLKSMALLATRNDPQRKDEDIERLTNMLWGDYFFEKSTRQFSPKRTSTTMERAFECFCLTPIYKVYAHVLGSDASDVAKQLQGLKLTKRDENKDALPLLKSCLRKLLPSGGPLVSAICTFVQPPNEFCAERLVSSGWNGGELLSDIGKEVVRASADGPLLLHGVKLVYPQDDPHDVLDDEEARPLTFNSEIAFRLLARVFSGTLKIGSEVFVREPSPTSSKSQIIDEDDDDTACKAVVRSIRLPSRGGGASCRLVDEAGPGTIVLISGIDSVVSKSATISSSRRMPYFPALRCLRVLSKAEPMCKLAMEPLVPSELPKMLSGLRAIQRSYPSSRVEVEESGEYVVRGTGELYLDCIMRDLRERFAKGTEVKVVDPFVVLKETCAAPSTKRTAGETSNGKNTFSFIAEPLNSRLAEDLERGKVDSRLTNGTSLEKMLKHDYGFDILASRSVWAFGPSDFGPNALLDDTLPPNKPENLDAVKPSVIEGFRWATREGPLCGEQVRGVSLKLFSAGIAVDERDRVPGQVIKTIKRLTHETILSSTPSLYEPVYAFDAIVSDTRAIGLVRNALAQRRGDTREVVRIPGTPLSRVRGYLPVLDSYGLETEIRFRSRGSVFPQMYFEGWSLVPGDPLDDSVALKPLEPSLPDLLARDLVIKTRRRKGLPELIEQPRTLDQQVLLRELERAKQAEQ